MASGHNNNWMTTFIFNQDLRSYYFNNLLFSIIQNGVFNYDISLGTSASSNTSTLVLTIKKGTTLVFSNDYVRNSITNKYERNFGSNINNTQENDSVALIKCVARQDMTADFNFSSEATISPNVTNERLFLIAYFQYNIDSAVDITVPRFGIFKKNTEENESYFSSVLGVDAGISITEGKTTFEKNVDGNLLYIILGVIEPTVV